MEVPFDSSSKIGAAQREPRARETSEILRFERPIQYDFDGRARLKNKIFSSPQQDRCGTGRRPDSTSNGGASAPIGDNSNQRPLSSGCAHSLSVVSFARIALNARFARSLTGPA